MTLQNCEHRYKSANLDILSVYAYASRELLHPVILSMLAALEVEASYHAPHGTCICIISLFENWTFSRLHADCGRIRPI